MDISSMSGSYSTTNLQALRNADKQQMPEPPDGPPPGGMPKGKLPEPSALLSAIKGGEFTVTENEDGTVTLSDGKNEFTLNLEEMIAHQEQQAKMSATYDQSGERKEFQQTMDDLIGTLVELTT